MGVKIILNIKPKPKPRIRLSKKAYYNGDWYEYQKDLAYLLWDNREKLNGLNFNEPLSIDIKLSKDKIILRLANIRNNCFNLRGDLDNYAKGILDCLQKVFKFNDKLIKAIKIKEIE